MCNSDTEKSQVKTSLVDCDLEDKFTPFITRVFWSLSVSFICHDVYTFWVGLRVGDCRLNDNYRRHDTNARALAVGGSRDFGLSIGIALLFGLQSI